MSTDWCTHCGFGHVDIVCASTCGRRCHAHCQPYLQNGTACASCETVVDDADEPALRECAICKRTDAIGQTDMLMTRVCYGKQWRLSQTSFHELKGRGFTPVLKANNLRRLAEQSDGVFELDEDDIPMGGTRPLYITWKRGKCVAISLPTMAHTWCLDTVLHAERRENRALPKVFFRRFKELSCGAICGECNECDGCAVQFGEAQCHPSCLARDCKVVRWVDHVNRHTHKHRDDPFPSTVSRALVQHNRGINLRVLEDCHIHPRMIAADRANKPTANSLSRQLTSTPINPTTLRVSPQLVLPVIEEHPALVVELLQHNEKFREYIVGHPEVRKFFFETRK